MSKSDRRIDVSDLPEDAAAKLPAGTPAATSDDVKGGVRIGFQSAERHVGKRYSTIRNVRNVRNVRGLREDGRKKTWMLQ